MASLFEKRKTTITPLNGEGDVSRSSDMDSVSSKASSIQFKESFIDEELSPDAEIYGASSEGLPVNRDREKKKVKYTKANPEPPHEHHVNKKSLGMCCSLRILLPTVLVLSIIVTVALVWGFTYDNTNKAIDDLSEQIRTQVSARINIDVTTELSIPMSINAVQNGYADLGYVDPDHLEPMRRIAFTHIKIFRSVTHVYFGTYNGDMIGYERRGARELRLWHRSNETGNMMHIYQVDSESGVPDPNQDPLLILQFNSVKRPWYQAAVEERRPTWSEIYLFSDNILGITSVKPIFDVNGDVIMCTASDRSLTKISNILENSVQSHTRASIIERNGLLVASSKENVTREAKRVNATDSVDDVTRESYQHLLKQENNLRNLNIPSNDTLSLEFEDSSGESILLNVLELQVDDAIQWLLIIAVPESVFTGTIGENNIFTIGISVGTVVINCLISIAITLLITSPLSRLQKQMRHVSVMNFDGILNRSSFLLEVRRIQASFFKMVYALQSFRKFVPEAIIKRTMDDNNIADLVLETQHVTIFFLDIVDFTAMSEQLETQELLTVVGEALEQLSLIVTQRYGIVDKYIGDAIMALFNVPDRIDNHCERACQVALECHDTLRHLHSEWAERGLPQLQCRIGINCGRSLVGNFGSSKRLNYTAIGDAVNVAARLEPLNKAYGTETLISESVYESVSETYCARAVDNVRLKGRQSETMVFELLGQRSQVSREILYLEQITLESMKAYRSGDICKAIEDLEEARTIPGYTCDNAILHVLSRFREMESRGVVEPNTLSEKSF